MLIPVMLSDRWDNDHPDKTSGHYMFYCIWKNKVLMVDHLSYRSEDIFFTGKTLEDSMRLRSSNGTCKGYYNKLTPRDIVKWKIENAVFNIQG
jgi:hypothetical protein